MTAKCSVHPRYKGVRIPKANCVVCWDVWMAAPMGTTEALRWLLSWASDPSTRHDVPGSNDMEQAHYRTKVRRTVRRLIDKTEKG